VTLAPALRGTNPFERDGVWLKCALHTHTTESDGEAEPRFLVRYYQEAGFDTVAITDHWRLTLVPSTDRLLTIPAAELTYDVAPGRVGEFLAYGITELIDDPGGMRENWISNEEEHWEQRTFPDFTTANRWAAAQGAVTYAAHPYWSGLDPSVLLEAEGFAGLEVYNATSEVENGRGDSAPWWDALLGAGKLVFATASDDQHAPLFDLGLAWTMVRAADRSVEAVVDALRVGSSYASAGPAILEAHVDGDGVEVACSPCRAVVLGMAEERGASVVAGERGRWMGRVLETSDDGLIIRARVESTEPEPGYLRVSVVDASGHKAWTNPL
jgi:predicted metal-dependent phosphoesterase TrpH